MTYAEAKRELNSYQYRIESLEDMQDELKEFEARVESCTAKLKDVNVQDSQRPGTDDNMAEIADLRERYIRKLLRVEDHCKAIKENVERLESPYRELLYYRYVRGFDLKHTAKKMRYEYTYTSELLADAIKKYADL